MGTLSLWNIPVVPSEARLVTMSVKYSIFKIGELLCSQSVLDYIAKTPPSTINRSIRLLLIGHSSNLVSTKAKKVILNKILIDRICNGNCLTPGNYTNANLRVSIIITLPRWRSMIFVKLATCLVGVQFSWRDDDDSAKERHTRYLLPRLSVSLHKVEKRGQNAGTAKLGFESIILSGSLNWLPTFTMPTKFKCIPPRWNGRG